jgi:hypothetical protein
VKEWVFSGIMALQKYASMADLRGAIRHYRVIRFTYEGASYIVEPHQLERNPLTGTYELQAWTRSSPGGGNPGWMMFHYWGIRALVVLPDTFLPRVRETAGGHAR